MVFNSEDGNLKGNIQNFFPLIGNVDFISSMEKSDKRYIKCWFDDSQDDLGNVMRRLIDFTVPLEIACTVDGKGRKTYNANFNDEHGKLT